MPASAPAPAPRRRAERRPTFLTRTRTRIARIRDSRFPATMAALIVLAGLGAVVVAAFGIGPAELSPGGSAAIASAYTWALAARTGGRPVVFGFLAAVVGAATVALDQPILTTGAAVMTGVVASILGVMATVPAVKAVSAAREALFAVLIAGVGAVAVVGFEPTISLARFEYSTLGLALVGALLLVFRLGAGLHGLGRRGMISVVVGSVMLAVLLAYAELLRRYGTPGLVEWLLDGVAWSRENLLAFPRPIEAILGIPALTWGCHMRARRRQGWWVCVFGVAATAPVTTSLLNLSVSRVESVLASAYAVVVGVVIGFLLIRIDLALTAPRGTRGRRGRRAEEATAVRPEPRRSRPLL